MTTDRYRERMSPTTIPTDDVRPTMLAKQVLQSLAERRLVFQRDGDLVEVARVVVPQSPTTTIQVFRVRLLSRNRLATLIREKCQFTKAVDGNAKEFEIPEWLVNLVLGCSLDDVPYIHGVWNAPIVDSDLYTITKGQEYDRSSGWFIDFPDDGLVKYMTGRESLAYLVYQIFCPLCYIAFATELDKSVFLSALLTAMLGPSCQNVPGIGITSGIKNPSKGCINAGSGAGKSTLLRVLGVVATGRDPSFPPIGNSSADLERHVDQQRYKGDWFVPLDNIVVPLDGARLNQILTNPKSEVPFKGRSYTRYAPFLAFSGNGLEVDGDLRRRVLRLELLPRTEEAASSQKIVDGMLSFRPLLIQLLCKLVVDAGRARKRAGTSRPITPSFEIWSALVRDTVIDAGLPDPEQALFANFKQPPMLPQSVPRPSYGALRTPMHSDVFHDFLYALTEGKKFTAAALALKIGVSGILSDELKPDLAGRDGRCTPLSIGKKLAQLKGWRVGDHTIMDVGRSGGVASWIVLDNWSGPLAPDRPRHRN